MTKRKTRAFIPVFVRAPIDPDTVERIATIPGVKWARQLEDSLYSVLVTTSYVSVSELQSVVSGIARLPGVNSATTCTAAWSELEGQPLPESERRCAYFAIQATDTSAVLAGVKTITDVIFVEELRGGSYDVIVCAEYDSSSALAELGDKIKSLDDVLLYVSLPLAELQQ